MLLTIDETDQKLLETVFPIAICRKSGNIMEIKNSVPNVGQ